MLWTIVTPHSNVQCYSRLVNKDRCFVVTWVILYLCNIKAVNVLKGSYMSLSTFQRATTMWGIDKVSFQLKSLHYKQIIGKWLTSRKWEMLVGGDVWFLPSDNKSLPLLSVNSNIVSVSKFQSSFNKSRILWWAPFYICIELGTYFTPHHNLIDPLFLSLSHLVPEILEQNLLYV